MSLVIETKSPLGSETKQVPSKPSATLAAINKHIGRRLNWLYDKVASGMVTAKAVLKGDATVQVRRLSDSEKRLKASQALARQITGLSEDQLKAMQAELHRELETRRKAQT